MRILCSIVEAQPEKLQSVEIATLGRVSGERVAIAVTDRDELTSICSALAKSRWYAPNHPGMFWWARVTMNWPGESLGFVVNWTENNGILIYLEGQSRSGGYDLGVIRCDEMGDVLKTILSKRGHSIHHIDRDGKITEDKLRSRDEGWPVGLTTSS